MTIRTDFDEQYPPGMMSPGFVEMVLVGLMMVALFWLGVLAVFYVVDERFSAGMRGLDERQMLLRLTNAGAFDHGGLRLVQEPGSLIGVMSFRGKDYACTMDVMTQAATGCRFLD